MCRKCILVMLLASSLLLIVHAQEPDSPRLPGARLLVEVDSPERLLLTSENSELLLVQAGAKSGPSDFTTVGLYCGSASVSSDGNTIALGRRGSDHGTVSRLSEMIVATYSVRNAKWTNHPHLHAARGPVAISPDASKLLYVSQVASTTFELRLLDLKTENTNVIATIPQQVWSISWAPDNRRFVFEGVPNIFVGDISSKTVARIGIGKAASWSPSGEWVAFVACDPSDCHSNSYRLSIMSPAGTEIQSLMSFHSDVNPCTQPVWSPDSKKILFTKSRNPDLGTRDAYMVELPSGNRQKVFKKSASVLGWVKDPK